MGAWGAGVFENDDAWDWASEFGDNPSIEFVDTALRTVADYGDEYLELPECGAALAAAEFVAALHGHPAPDLPVEIRAHVAGHDNTDLTRLLPLALAAVDRVARESEMKELWDETDDPSAWHAAIADLRSRLS